MCLVCSKSDLSRLSSSESVTCVRPLIDYAWFCDHLSDICEYLTGEPDEEHKGRWICLDLEESPQMYIDPEIMAKALGIAEEFIHREIMEIGLPIFMERINDLSSIKKRISQNLGVLPDSITDQYLLNKINLIRRAIQDAEVDLTKEEIIELIVFIESWATEEGVFPASQIEGLPRTVQVMGNGEIFIHFNQTSKNVKKIVTHRKPDKLLGEGNFSKVKYSLNYGTGELVARGTQTTTKSRLTHYKKVSERVSKTNLEGVQRVYSVTEIRTHKPEKCESTDSVREQTLMEMYKGGAMGRTIYYSKSKNPPIPTFSEEQVLETYRQALSIVRSVMRLHDIGIIHGDIKPANILIKIEGKQKNPIVCDLGLSVLVDEPNKTEFFGGTPLFRPQDFLDDLSDFGDEVITTSIDVFAVATMFGGRDIYHNGSTLHVEGLFEGCKDQETLDFFKNVREDAARLELKDLKTVEEFLMRKIQAIEIE